MIWVRFRQAFRERQMEFALAAGQTAWGLILLLPAPVFANSDFWAPLARIAREEVWGWAMFLLGIVGLAVLTINGAWRRTPAWRSGVSWARITVWVALLVGTLQLDWQSPSSAIYAMILMMEIMALSNATADRVVYRSRANASAN